MAWARTDPTRIAATDGRVERPDEHGRDRGEAEPGQYPHRPDEAFVGGGRAVATETGATWAQWDRHLTTALPGLAVHDDAATTG